MSNVMKIGQYQLLNLQRNKVRFLYLDLRPPELRAKEAPGHEVFAGSHSVKPEDVLGFVASMGAAPDTPIVLICGNEVNSMAAGEALGEKSFINVFVVEGGTGSLDLG